MNQPILSEECVFRDFTHFTFYLYFYMAFSDAYLDEKEAQMIRKKMQERVSGDTDINQLFEKIQSTYEQTPVDQLDEVVQLNFKQFKEQSQEFKYTLFTDLYDIMIADGVVHYKENESLDKLKKLVNTYL